MAISRSARVPASVQPAPGLRITPKPATTVMRQGVFDSAIQDILAAPQYLTPENIAVLRAVLPPEKVGDIESTQVNLSGLLQSLTLLHKRMQTIGMTSNDPVEIKNMIATTKTVIEMARKHQDDINDQARQIHLENTIVETFDALGNPELKSQFLAIFAKKLKS